MIEHKSKISFSYFRRTYSGLICDILPVKEEMRKTSEKIRVPEFAFKITDYEDWKSCGTILETTSLNMEEIIDEIVEEDYFKNIKE